MTTPQDRSSRCRILRYDERLFPSMRTASFLFLFFCFFFQWTADSSSRNSFNSMSMRDSLPILLIKSNYKGSGLLSHLWSWFDSGACASHILRSGFQHSHSSCAGFITELKYLSLLEVIFTIYSTHKSRKFMNKYVIFLTHKRVLRVLEKRETSTAKAGARDARANRETGF